jgi:hypothetical protein
MRKVILEGREFNALSFFCGLPPIVICERDGPRKGSLEKDGEIIKIPITSIYGAKDSVLDDSLTLAKMCRRDKSRELDHKGGHEIPKSPKLTRHMAELISETIDSLESETL